MSEDRILEHEYPDHTGYPSEENQHSGCTSDSDSYIEEIRSGCTSDFYRKNTSDYRQDTDIVCHVEHT